MMDKPNNTNDKVYFNLTYFALKLLGKSLYSNAWTAISELVANGIDANANHVKLLIDMRNKKHATIEVYDDGDGMSYDEIVEKYVVIGKDKRLEDGLTKRKSEEMLGRKGIGKLATLYLSNNYYIYTKKNKKQIDIWNFKYDNKIESHYPLLKRVSKDYDVPYCYKMLGKEASGTIINLTNVDMSNIGYKTIEGLKQTISDYYLFDNLNSNISVCILENENDKIKFDEIKKIVAYKNFYAIYDNTKNNIYSLMSKDVYIKSNIPEVFKKKRKTVLLTNIENCSGNQEFLRRSDNKKIRLTYNMVGWIAMHSTIDSDIALKNDSRFLKNKAYNPFKLKLYVRNKLAVENFMTYLNNVHAMSNYIEGEISFDILDSNELDDIATSNREGFPRDDERIQLLISILRPIVNKLINERVDIGNVISNEENIIREKEEEKRRIAEQKSAEVEQKYIEEKKVRITTEVKLDEEKQKNSVLKRQNTNLFNSINADQFDFVKKTHLIKTNILSLKKSFQALLLKIDLTKYKDIKNISLCIDKILSLVKYGARASFNMESETINNDLAEFIQQYCNEILSIQYSQINIKVNNNAVSKKSNFNPQYIALIFDNMLSNSKKSKSKEIEINIELKSNKYTIEYIDDGVGLKKESFNNLFELGVSYTNGTGIGMYNVKQAIQEMHGDIEVDKGYKNGARFIFTLGGNK